MMKAAPLFSLIFPRRREKTMTTSEGRLSSFLPVSVQARMLIGFLLLWFFGNLSGTASSAYADNSSARWSTEFVHTAASVEKDKATTQRHASAREKKLFCQPLLTPTDTARGDSSEVGAHPRIVLPQQPSSPVAARTQALRNSPTAYNVSPISWDVYQYIGRETTFITDRKAITDILGNLCEQMSVSIQEATRLETALGLKEGSLQNGFKIREISLTGMPPERIRVPEHGNKHFLGKGKGLPGGGPELELQPRVSTKDNAEVRTIATVSILKLF